MRENHTPRRHWFRFGLRTMMQMTIPVPNPALRRAAPITALSPSSRAENPRSCRAGSAGPIYNDGRHRIAYADHRRFALAAGTHPSSDGGHRTTCVIPPPPAPQQSSAAAFADTDWPEFRGTVRTGSFYGRKKLRIARRQLGKSQFTTEKSLRHHG